MSFVRRLAKAVIREGLTALATAAAQEAGEAIGKRFGAWYYPEGVESSDDEEDDEDGEDEEDADKAN